MDRIIDFHPHAFPDRLSMQGETAQTMWIQNIFTHYGIFFLLTCFLLIPSDLRAWELIRQQDNISIYTQSVKHSEIKAIKAVTYVKASMDRLVSLTMDFSFYPEWITRCKEARILRDINDNEKIAYAKIDLPWPARDREVIFRNTLSRETTTVSVTINVQALPGQPSHNNNIVYLEKLTGSWKFTPLHDGTIEIVANGHCDPESRLPSWFINSFIARLAHLNLFNMLQVIALQL
jgi:ribosome-associated toxin RatA of RatAB toxin-antitoxin module